MKRVLQLNDLRSPQFLKNLFDKGNIMLVLLVSTYWLFLSVSLGTFCHLLWQLNPQMAVTIVGFFVLSKITKAIAEYNLTKIVAEKQAVLMKEWSENQKKQTSNPVEAQKVVPLKNSSLVTDDLNATKHKEIL